MAKPRKPKSDPTARMRVDEIVKQYRAFFDVTTDLRTAMKEDLDFTVGGRKQWAQATLAELDAEKRPALSFNKVAPTINFICGLQQEREVDYRYFPRGDEDEQLGRILTSQVKYIMDASGGQHEEATQFRLGAIGGWCTLEVGHSYDYTDDLIEGDVTMTALAMNTTYLDPLARRYDKCDARYQGKLMWYGAEAAQKAWPESAAKLTGMADWLPYDPLTTGVPEHLLRELYDKETNRIRVLQHWFKVPVTATLLINKAEPDPAKAVQRMKDGKEAQTRIEQEVAQSGLAAAAQYSIVQDQTLYALVNKQTGGMMPLASPDEGEQFIARVKQDAGAQVSEQYEILSREATALRVSHLTGWELLDEKPSPYDDDWRYPFSHFFFYHDGDNFGDIKGVSRDIKDPQREINWHHNTLVDTLARAPKGATWFDKASNANITELKKKLPRAGFIGEYTGSMPQYWPAASFNPGDLAMMEMGNDFVHSISGTDNLQANPQQKTVSGRAIGARFAGGLVALGTPFQHWQRTKIYTGTLLAKRVQQFHSPEKMDRILGQDYKMAEVAGLDLKMLIPPHVLYDQYTRIADLAFDVVVGFQDASTTAREANLNRLLQMMAMGIPVPPQLILEASDVPYKEEIKSALSKQGMQPPNPELAKVLTGMQGQGSADGVNKA